MNRTHARDIVVAAVKAAFILQGNPDTEITLDTPIYGPTTQLDSLGYIAFTLNVEDAMRAEGVEIYLASDGTFDPAVHCATVESVAEYLMSVA